MLQGYGIPCDKLIVVEVSKDYLLEQHIHRRMDPQTGRNYDIKKDVVQNPDIAARLVTRENDKQEKVLERFNKFEAQIKDIATAYKKKTLYVNGVVGNPGEVSVFFLCMPWR